MGHIYTGTSPNFGKTRLAVLAADVRPSHHSALLIESFQKAIAGIVGFGIALHRARNVGNAGSVALLENDPFLVPSATDDPVLACLIRRLSDAIDRRLALSWSQNDMECYADLMREIKRVDRLTGAVHEWAGRRRQ